MTSEAAGVTEGRYPYQSFTNISEHRVAISIPPFDRENICPLTNQTFSQHIKRTPIYLVAIVVLADNNKNPIYCDANALYKHFITEKEFTFPACGDIVKSVCKKVSFCALQSIERLPSDEIRADAELEAMPTRSSFINTLLIACSHQDDEYNRRARPQVIMHYVTNKNYNKAWDWSQRFAENYSQKELMPQFVSKIEHTMSEEAQSLADAFNRHIGFLRNHLRCKKIADIAKTVLPLAAGACLMLPIPEKYKLVETIIQATITLISGPTCRELTRTRKVILTASLGASLYDIPRYITHGLQASIVDITKVVGTSLSFLASTASLIHNHFKFRNILRYVEKEPLEIREVDIV